MRLCSYSHFSNQIFTFVLCCAGISHLGTDCPVRSPAPRPCPESAVPALFSGGKCPLDLLLINRTGRQLQKRSVGVCVHRLESNPSFAGAVGVYHGFFAAAFQHLTCRLTHLLIVFKQLNGRCARPLSRQQYRRMCILCSPSLVSTSSLNAVNPKKPHNYSHYTAASLEFQPKGPLSRGFHAGFGTFHKKAFELIRLLFTIEYSFCSLFSGHILSKGPLLSFLYFPCRYSCTCMEKMSKQMVASSCPRIYFTSYMTSRQECIMLLHRAGTTKNCPSVFPDRWAFFASPAPRKYW